MQKLEGKNIGKVKLVKLKKHKHLSIGWGQKYLLSKFEKRIDVI